MEMNNVVATVPQSASKVSLVNIMASRYNLEPGKFLATLKATAFRQRDGVAISDEQMAALCVVSNQYGLNPFIKEIYAYPDKNAGIVPVVSVDGWARIINDHKNFDGMDFRYSENVVTPAGGKPCPEWCEVIMYRKDRAHPVIVREYLDEVYRPAFKTKNGFEVVGPWQSHTKRMLRHKVTIQGARLAFGFGGIFEQDEAERIIEAEAVRVEPVTVTPAATQTAAVKNLLGITDPKPEIEVDMEAEMEADFLAQLEKEKALEGEVESALVETVNEMAAERKAARTKGKSK